MTRSDDTPIVDADYAYNASASVNRLTVIIGIPIVFDLNTEEVSPLTDDQLNQLNTWLHSEEGQLVQQTGAAIAQYGYQDPGNETLLVYYLISMLVDYDESSQAIMRVRDQRSRSHHTKLSNCAAPTTEAATIQGCYGCCGPNCWCVPSRSGTAIYTSQCASHDQCTAQQGSRFAGACFGKFAKAAASVVAYWYLVN